MPEEDIAEALMVSGISFESPVDTFKELIRKHCNIDEINFRVSFREVLLEDGFRTETKNFMQLKKKLRPQSLPGDSRMHITLRRTKKGRSIILGQSCTVMCSSH